VAGRPVAQIVPLRRDTWAPAAQLQDLVKLRADSTLRNDVQGGFHASLSDRWSE
jgi:antitoxin (DNA-binding transcriptional repressor) of toxin-antitoxin stability system